MKSEILELLIDKDTCPEEDNIIMHGQCDSCKYFCAYSAFEGMPSVKCGYYHSTESDK